MFRILVWIMISLYDCISEVKKVNYETKLFKIIVEGLIDENDFDP